MGKVRRGQPVPEDGEHPVRGAVPAADAQLPEGADEELCRAAPGARLSRVSGQDIPRPHAAQAAGGAGAETEHDAHDLRGRRVLQTFARHAGRLQRGRQGVADAAEADRAAVRAGGRLPQGHVLRGGRAEQFPRLVLRLRLGRSVQSGHGAVAPMLADVGAPQPGRGGRYG